MTTSIPSDASPEARCRRYRRRILEISQQTTCHVASAFSCLEIVDCLYHQIMNPSDVFIMSKGHGYLAQLVVLEDLGKISRRDLEHYCLAGGALGAHPDYAPHRGIEASTGSLGHGLGIAAGRALAQRLGGVGGRTYCLLSDGECQEGSTWEAAMVAANLGLGGLAVVVDLNNWGGMECMTDAFPALAGMTAKFRAFGWAAHECWGHDAAYISNALRAMSTSPAVPRALVCRTEKGRGVSFIRDGQPLWHYRSPNAEEYQRALREIG